MKLLSSALLLAVLLALVACAPAADEPPPVVEETATIEADSEPVRQAIQELVAATVAGDPEAYAGCFTEEAIMMVPNAPSVVGKEAIQASLEATLALYDTEWTNTIEEIVMAGDWAFERSSYRWTLRPKGEAEPLDEVGKILAVWHRDPDGSWRRARIMWNSDGPMD